MSPVLGTTAFFTAALLYGSATLLYYLDVARGRGGTELPARVPALLIGAGATAHLAFVLLASLVVHACPIYSIHFFLSVAVVLATGVYLLARRRWRIHAVGLVLAPVGLLLTLSTFALGRPGHPGELSPSFIGLHVFANLCGASLFLLAGGAALLYLVQERRFKRKRSVLRGRLPPLDALDRAAHRFLLAGFPLLTLGVATGTLGARHLESGTAADLLRTLFGWATWLVFGGVLVLRSMGWHGRKAALGTVAGLACAAIVVVIYVLRSLLPSTGALGG